MPNDLSIKAVGAVSGASENPAEPQTAQFIPPAQAPPVHNASPLPNPQLRLDPALGLVVIEFRDDSGAVTTSIPSARQLHAYRMWEHGQSGHDRPAQAGPHPPAAPHVPGTAAPGGHVSGLAEPGQGAPEPASVHTSETRKA